MFVSVNQVIDVPEELVVCVKLRANVQGTTNVAVIPATLPETFKRARPALVIQSFTSVSIPAAIFSLNKIITLSQLSLASPLAQSRFYGKLRAGASGTTLFTSCSTAGISFEIRNTLCTYIANFNPPPPPPSLVSAVPRILD